MRHMFRRIIAGDYFPVPEVRPCSRPSVAVLRALACRGISCRWRLSPAPPHQRLLQCPTQQQPTTAHTCLCTTSCQLRSE